MADIVDILIPANSQAAAQELDLVVSRGVTDGARGRVIPREEAEIAVACLHDYGFIARIVEPGTAGSNATSLAARHVVQSQGKPPTVPRYGLGRTQPGDIGGLCGRSAGLGDCLC